MKKQLMIFILIIMSATAEEEKLKSLTTADGKTYKSVSVMKVTPASIRIIHSSGAASIPLEKLSAELQQKYNYDPEKAKIYKSKVDKANSAYIKKQDALIRKQREQQRAKTKLKSEMAKAQKSHFIVVQVTKGGVLARYYYPGGVGNDGSGRRVVVRSRSSSGMSFLTGDLPTNLVDGATFEAFYIKAGTYQYTAVSGATKTIPKVKILKIKK